MITLTKKLVSIASVNTTPGEKAIGLYIEDYLRAIPYFKEHPEKVIIQPLKDDLLGRRNVLAWIKGEKEESKETIIFHGHTDTVGVEDFGKFKAHAFDCDKLMEVLKQMDLPAEVAKDLASGDYLFGRGACDMKSGDAVFLVLAKAICKQIKALKGNIILSFNPVEENLHTGIIEAGTIFKKLREEEGLRYVLAINNDYICPLYPNDSNRYVYTGSVGKLLPCFYIEGKETHVGQCFEGFDASMVAAELIREINLNPKYCEGYNGEYTLPPSVLKMKDLKEQYNVQTSFASFVYFNYFIHNASLEEIMSQLKGAGQKALDNVLDIMNNRYQAYCQLSKVACEPLEYTTQVIDYEQLVSRAKAHYEGDLDQIIHKIAEEGTLIGKDKREIPLEIVRKLCEIANFKMPTIVLFFAAPYCPHNTLKQEVKEEDNLYQKIKGLTKSFGETVGEHYEVLQFFPSLTDSSYLKIDDAHTSITHLKANFPEYDTLYPVPLEQIKDLNIPAINFGCYGKDAHKWTERVYMPYSFEVLPKLIIETIKAFLGE